MCIYIVCVHIYSMCAYIYSVCIYIQCVHIYTVCAYIYIVCVHIYNVCIIHIGYTCVYGIYYNHDTKTTPPLSSSATCQGRTTRPSEPVERQE